MKYLEMSCLDIGERKKLEEKGLYCYDLRLSDLGGEIASIEKSVLVNRVGSIVTDEEIPLGNKYPNNYKDYDEFVKENEEVYKIEHLIEEKFKSITRKLDNNIYILDIGYRNNKPVVLVEKKSKYGKEYIIGFNYNIINNKIDWAYGYYYDNDKEKARKDFNKVVSGDNLADTFNKKERRKDNDYEK